MTHARVICIRPPDPQGSGLFVIEVSAPEERVMCFRPPVPAGTAFLFQVDIPACVDVFFDSAHGFRIQIRPVNNGAGPVGHQVRFFCA